ncbi:MAG TPA: hypothetical protein VKV73_19220 [Chloroflexota bacterium]|nr:hypothetical protein [Chloroflexota bacterium]
MPSPVDYPSSWWIAKTRPGCKIGSPQARSRLAELKGRRAVSAQFEPMAGEGQLYCELMRDRLNDLTFEEKREVLEALEAQFTLEKDGKLRIVLVLPTGSDICTRAIFMRLSCSS